MKEHWSYQQKIREKEEGSGKKDWGQKIPSSSHCNCKHGSWAVSLSEYDGFLVGGNPNQFILDIAN